MKNDRCSYNIAERLTGKGAGKDPSHAHTETVAPVSPSPPRMVMTVEEMRKELGISRATAYELTQQPDFPSFSIGRRVLVSCDGLLKWIEKQYSSKGMNQDAVISA